MYIAEYEITNKLTKKKKRIFNVLKNHPIQEIFRKNRADGIKRSRLIRYAHIHIDTLEWRDPLKKGAEVVLDENNKA